MAVGRGGSRGWLRRLRKRRFGIATGFCVLVLLASYGAVLEYSRPHVSGDALTLTTFVQLASSGRLKDARVLDVDSYVVGAYVSDNGRAAQYNTPYLRATTTRERILDILLTANVPTTIDQQTDKNLVSLASILVPSLILVLLFAYLVVSYRRGTGLFNVRSGARKVSGETTAVTFANVAGQDAAITELREIAQFLAAPERFAAVGARVPKGILLYGPPGCGKTLMAKALAGEVGATFFSISGSDFVELYVGVGAARVRDLFKEAREHAPAIVFIDELDSIGRARGVVGTVQSQGEQEQALNQILAEMDGFSTEVGIIVVAATNRPDIIDPALLRPGRFDRTVALERPDEQGRRAILSVHSKGKPLHPTVDLAVIAQRAIGLTGADLAGVVNEAALLAARDSRGEITQPHLAEALQRVLDAPERQRRLSLRTRTIGKRFTAEKRVTFADLAGVAEATTELAEVKEYLADPERFARMGARLPGGILLVGPPGCGKTLLARAVAGETNAAFLSVAASEFVEVFVGEGASRVRELFSEARAICPAIVFIDEIDAVGARRGSGGSGGNREMDQTLNQILIELDGFEGRSGVVVMAATNRPDILDSALVRPGRFDRRVTVELPDREGRIDILRLHARGRPLANDVDFDEIARHTQGFSGAELAGVMNEATLLAARVRKDEVPMSFVEEAVERTVLGAAARSHVTSDVEKRLIAYHEAGHAVVRRALPGSTSPRKISIIPRGRMLGVTWMQDDDRLLRSRSHLLDQMAGLLAGRAAEDLIFGEQTTGASDDIARAGALARRMVTELGMSKALGPLPYERTLGDPTGGYSDEVAAVIDSEVRALADEAYARAMSVLRASLAALDAVATALIERETITAEDLERIITAEPDAPRLASDGG